MTYSNISRRRFLRVSLITAFIVAIASFGLWSSKGPEVDKTMIESYELSMNGKADEAKALLEQFLSDFYSLTNNM